MDDSNPRKPGLAGLVDTPLSRRQLVAGAGRGALGLAAMSALGVSMPAVARAAAADYGKRPYKIGFMAPSTGPFAPEGGSLVRGTDLGLEVLNKAGGIAGHPVQMLTQDTRSSAATAATIAKKFLQRDKVDMLIGTIAFDEENVVNQLATRAKVPFVTMEAGPWVPWCGGPTVILGETSQQLLDPLIPFMAKKFGKKWVLVGSDFGFPREYFKVAKAAMAKEGVQVLSEQYAPPGTTDWSSVVGKLKATNADVILGGVVGGDSIAFVKAAASLGLIPKMQLTGVTLQAEFYPAMGHAVDGMFSSVRYTEELSNPANDEMKKLYRAKYGKGPIPLVATTAYYSFNFIKAAVEMAKSYDPEAVIAAFRSGNVKAMSVVSDQPLTVEASSLAVKYPMYICQIKSGGVWSIVDKVGVVPPGISC